MRFIPSLLFFTLSTVCAYAQNKPPVIEALTATPDWANNKLTVQYDVSDGEGDVLDVKLEFSNDGGKTYKVTPVIALSGDVGYPVPPGSNRLITCDVSQLPAGPTLYQIRLTADDRQPFDIQALVNEVDSNRLRADLDFVEGIRHRTAGAAHLAAVRDSMKRLLSNAGLFVEEQTFTYTNTTGRNVLGTLRGTGDAQKTVIVDAHYDTVANAPGADDNGSGTVGVWEIARLLSRYPAKKTLRYIGFDLEEAGLIGSTRFVTNGIPAGDQIEGVLNFEMIGFYSEKPGSQTLPTGFDILFPGAYNEVFLNQSRGDFITNVGNSASSALAALFANSASQYVPGLKVITVVVPGNGSIAPDLQRSDHAPFWVAGHKALMLTDGANFRNTSYHTPNDVYEDKLNFTFMSNVVKAALATAAQLAELQHGAWATTGFEKSTSVPSPADNCAPTLSMGNSRNLLNLHLQRECRLSLADIELYDENGRMVLHREVLNPVEGNNPVFLDSSLARGAYLAKIRLGEGVLTQVVTIF